jgi:hypothetical protein
MICTRWALLSSLVCGLLVGAGAEAQAQGRQGVYQVVGHDVQRGAYRGRVELRWSGADYAFLREVEYTAFAHSGRPVSTVWSGRAVDTPQGLSVLVSLDRMGWASRGAGITRTAADGVPLVVSGAFTVPPGGADLAGSYPAQGAGFAARNEAWTYAGPTGVQPIWLDERRVIPTHDPQGAVTRRLMDLLFSPFHATTWVQPYVGRSEFQAGVHFFVHDRTDFSLHQARPDLLRVIGRLVDPLSLAEAAVKADAFGKTLVQKAVEADRDLPGRYLDAGFLSGRLPGGGFMADGDSAEWTGNYAWSQALRYRTTGEPAALANLEHVLQALVDCVDIVGQPGEFGRALRQVTGPAPLGPLWHRGQGRFAGVEWLEGGNNDMLKGYLAAGVGALDALPPGHRLQGELARVLAQLADHSPVVQDGKFNELMCNGVVSAVQGPGRHRDRYRHISRNPFLQLYTVAIAAGFHYQGISDWSGAQLELTTLMIMTRLAEHHGARWVGLVNRLGIRRAARRQARARRPIHVIAAAGLAALPRPWAPYDPDDAVWVLREMPYPRPLLDQQRSLRADWCLSRWPELFWKFDWIQARNRAQGHVGAALFEENLSNYWWKNNPFGGLAGNGGGGVDWSPGDYLLAYWLARAYGVIGPND